MQDSSKPIWFKKENHPIGMKVGEPEIKIYVATPVHSECSIHYTQALLKFQQACMMNNIMVSFSLLKSSLVTQGRNLCVANFLGDPMKYTHMLFIDSDIDFKYETIMKMLKFDKEVVATPYPMKHIHWEQIWERLQQGKIKNKEELMRAGFIYPIKMEGLEAKNNPYMYNFFDTVHDPVNKKYYGEDFGFCRKWTKIGGKCYCYVDDYITHVGEYSYNGRLKDNLEMVNTVDDSLKNK